MRIKIAKNTIEYENLFFAVCLSFTSILNFLYQSLIFIIGSTHRLDVLISYGLLVTLFIKVVPSLIRNINKWDLLIVFFGVLTLSLSLLSINADTSLVKDEVFRIIRQCIILYLGAKVAFMSSKLIMYMRIAAYITIIRVVADIYLFSTTSLATGYSQYDGYMFLNGIAMLFLPLMSEKRPIDWAITIITLVLTLLSGARGPFLIIVVMIIVGLMLSGTGTKKKYLAYAMTIILSIIVYNNLKNILTYIAIKFGGGASLRIVNRMMNGIFFEDMWRPKIYSFAIDYINSHWFFGSGLFNDRVLINKQFSGLGEISGSYPHNFFLEIGMQYGAILGLIISVGFVVVLIRRFTRSHTLEERFLMLGLIFSGFLPLMVSGSYLSYPMFYALIGFCNSKFANGSMRRISIGS